jgi:hypothetical protein
MHRLLFGMGVLWLALGGLALAQRPGETGGDWWLGPGQLGLGLVMFALGALARRRGWALYRPDPTVERIFERLRLDQTYAASEAVKDLLRSGHEIAAIKVYRQASGVGLREAKEAVEAVDRALKRGDAEDR